MIRRFFPHISIVGAIVTSTFAASIGLIGGVALQSVEKELFVLIPLVIALPALNMMAGDYASLIAAHAGDLQHRKTLNRKLLLSLLGALPISIAGVITLSIVIASLQNYSLTQEFMMRFSIFVIVALLSVVAVVYLSTTLLDGYLAKKKVNSDDVLIPFSNVLASVMMLGWFALGAWLIF
jgi:cation transporter-like permease